MKLKKFLINFITIFVLLFVGTVSAETTAPGNFTVNGDDVYVIETSKYLSGATWNTHYKLNTDGHIIYCVQSHHYAVEYGIQKYTLYSEVDAKYSYVLNNGYPNKSITGDKEKDYFITAFAIYYLVDPSDYIFDHFDFNNGTYRGVANDAVKEIAKLINGANSYSYVDPTIKIDGNNNAFSLSSDKKYYVSSSLSVTTVGNVHDYVVGLSGAPSGTIVTDVNGVEKKSFGTGEKFIVMVPVSSISELSNEFNINVSANGGINKAYLYKPEEEKYQNTISLYSENKNITDTTTIKLNLTTKVEISKVDATTSEELAGATLTIKNSNGEVVKTWISSNEPEIIENLPVGKYTLTEEMAPDGYELSKKTIEFEVKLDGTVTKVEMENIPKQKAPIYISKQDMTTGEELAGAHLELRDEEGNLVEAWVSDDTPHMIEELEPGKYILTEVLAPEGYELSTETVEFTVKKDGTVDGDIIMYNEVQTVEVPGTSSFKNITTSLIGIIVIGLGSMIIYKNYKKNEEY